MATITGSTAHSSWTFKLEVTETATSIPNNTSSVKVDVYIGRTGSGSYMYGAKIPVTVKCTGVANKSFTYSNSAKVTVAAGAWLNIGSVTFTGVPHNADGSKTVTVSASFTNNVSPASGSASGSFALTTLPRKSGLTASNGTLGTAQTLTIDRKATSFTHTITYKCGSASGTIATKTTAASVSWTPPLSLANQNQTGTSVSVTFTITTYSGSTSIGTSTKTITCTIPASVKPTCTLTLEDTTGWDDTYGSPVQGLSKIKITVNPTTAYSPIASYAISADGDKYATATATTGALKTAGSSVVSATVKDKRGRSGSASYTMNVQAYNPPNVSKLTVHRCNADGTENDQGAYIRAVFSATITALNNKNSATYRLRYKKTTATSWTSGTLGTLSGVYTVSDFAYIFAADSNSSYDVEITAEDRHGSATRSTSASTAFTLMNWGADGTSMAIGKVAEKADALEIGLRAYDQYGTHLSNGMSLYGGSSAPIDPDTTTEHLILTNQNGPTTGLWYIETIFYSTKLPTSDRRQTAMPYRRGGATYSRYYTAGAWSAWESEALAAYPVGSIYIAYNHTNPGTLFGGTWARLTDGFLWASRSTDTIGQTGGAKEVTLTEAQMPKHSHGGTYTNAGTARTHAWLASGGTAMGYDTVEAGGGQAHNNMPPYVQVSIWRRTA